MCNTSSARIITLLHLSGCLAGLFYLPLLMAAPPVANGASAGSCPAGFSCKLIIDEAGVFQQFLFDRNGHRYIQSIINHSNADGQMQMEAYVDGTDAGINGISAIQRVTVGGVDTLDSTVTLNTGWANTGRAAVMIDQNVTSSALAGVGYRDFFHHEIDHDSNGNQIGYFQALRQEVTGTTNAGGDGVQSNGRDIHVFESRKAAGTRTGGGGSASLPASSGGMMGGGGGGMGGMMGGGGGPTGGTMSWGAGDEIQAIYIGQVCSGCQNSNGMGMGMKAGGGGNRGGGGTTTTTTTTVPTTTTTGTTAGTTTTAGTSTGTTAGTTTTAGTSTGTTAGTTTTAGTSTGTTTGTSTTGSGGMSGGSTGGTTGGSTTTASSGGMSGGGSTGGGMTGGGGGGSMTGGGGMSGGGGMGMNGGVGSNVAFSYQSYQNLSSGAAAVATRDYLSTGVVNWNSVFGTTPAAP